MSNHITPVNVVLSSTQEYSLNTVAMPHLSLEDNVLLWTLAAGLPTKAHSQDVKVSKVDGSCDKPIFSTQPIQANDQIKVEFLNNRVPPRPVVAPPVVKSQPAACGQGKKPQPYTQSELKEDYVFSQTVTDALRVKSLTQTFEDLEELETFVKKLDQRAGTNDMVVTYNDESLYIKVKCKHQGCVFQHWYKFKTDKLGRPCAITAFRNINFNHCVSKHQGDFWATEWRR